jgi:glycosyltransferase involved in cell wall biosynthesis
LRILVFGINYSPEKTGIGPYTTGMAQHFAAAGHEVTVVTGLPHYPAWQRLAESEEAAADAQVTVKRRWHHIPRRPGAFGRVLYELSFLASGLASRGIQKPDAVIGIVPSLSGGILARLWARRLGEPYGVLFQDLAGKAAVQSGVGGAGWLASPVRGLERWMCRGAAAVSVISEGFRPYLEALGTPSDRIVHVPNWSHIEPPTSGRDDTRRRFGLPEDAFICLHAGNMGFKQGLENVLDAARLAQHEGGNDFLFVLLGDGARRAALQEEAARQRLANVRFLPVQPEDEFANLLGCADVLLLNQRASVTDMALPSKLTSYFAAGRSLIAAVNPDSQAGHEVRSSQAGRLVAPDDPEALLRAVRELAADAECRESLGRAGERYAGRLTPSASGIRLDAFLTAITGQTAAHLPALAPKPEVNA